MKLSPIRQKEQVTRMNKAPWLARETATECAAAEIEIEKEQREDGNWVLTSKDFPGLLLWGADLDELLADVPNVIKKLRNLNAGNARFIGVNEGPINRAFDDLAADAPEINSEDNQESDDAVQALAIVCAQRDALEAENQKIREQVGKLELQLAARMLSEDPDYPLSTRGYSEHDQGVARAVNAFPAATVGRLEGTKCD